MTPVLARIWRGERAFERVYRRHVADVYRYALVVLRDADDAEQVTQATFLSAYRAFDRGERPRNQRAWLLGLAHDACRRLGHPQDSAEEEEPEVHEDGPPTPAEIRRALAHLPFDQRAALVMRELEGRSYAEIARVLELSPAGVETLVFEARRALRERLEGALTCHAAERAIFRQLDGRLGRSERKPLRLHLRECPECAGFARSQLARRSAWKVLGSVTLPSSLQSFFGPGGVMETALDEGGGSASLGVVAKTLVAAVIGISGVVLLHDSLGYGTPSRPGSHFVGQPVPTVRAAERTTRPTVRPVRARAAPRSTSRTAASIAVPPRRREQPRIEATKRTVKLTPSRARSFQVRTRPRASSASPSRTAATDPPDRRQPPAPAPPAPVVPPVPAPPPLSTPQLPQTPPLPPLPPLPPALP